MKETDDEKNMKYNLYEIILQSELSKKFGESSKINTDELGNLVVHNTGLPVIKFNTKELVPKVEQFISDLLQESTQAFGDNVSRIESRIRELHEKLAGANSDYKYAEIYLSDLDKYLTVENEGKWNERLVPLEIDSGVNFKIKNEVSKKLKIDFDSFEIQNTNWFVSRNQVYDRETFSTNMKYVIKYKVSGHFDREQFKSYLEELNTIKKSVPYKSGFEIVYIDDGEEGAPAKYVQKDF